jgi:hypothetical protein
MSDAEDAAHRESKTSLWKSVVAVGTVVLAVGAAVLHYMGITSHHFRLMLLRVEPDLFPKQVDMLMVHGLYATTGRLMAVFSSIDEAALWHFLLILGIVFTGVLAGALLLKGVGRRVGSSTGNASASPLRKKIQESLGNASVAAAMVIGVPYAVLVLTMLLLIAVTVGRSAAAATVENELRAWSMGCEQAKSFDGCLTVSNGREALAKGFLIDSSDSHIAIFDIHLCKAVTLQRDGTVVTGDSPRLRIQTQSAISGKASLAASAPAASSSAGGALPLSSSQPACDVHALLPAN